MTVEDGLQTKEIYILSEKAYHSRKWFFPVKPPLARCGRE
jgi:hypothetical protein